MAQTGKAAKSSQLAAALPQKNAVSPVPSPGSVSESAPPASPASPDRSPKVPDFLVVEDIRRHIFSLPTREDLERFNSRVEKAFTEDITQLKADTSHLGARVESFRGEN